MNKVKFLVATLLGVLFVACSEEENLSQTGKTGFLVSLAEDVKVDSRKTPEELGKPAASQFKLKITNQTTGSELYSGSYTEDLIPVSAGMYEIEATYGDNPVLALNAPYYKGTAEADLADGESKTVQVNCKVANALASVVFDNSGTNTFESQFASYGVRVSVNGSSTTLTDNGKSAYYRAGSMPVFTFVGTLRNGGGEKEVPLENSDLSSPSTFAAGKHCRITLKLSDAAPGLRVEISKVEVNSVTLNETIPLEWLPKPKVTAEGFDGNNTLNFVETEAVTPKLDFALSSALQDMKLKFDFEDEQFASLDKEKEYLLSNAADKAAIEEALGILLPDVGDTQANIDLSALTDKLHTNNGTATTNTITVDVQANNRWSSEDESTNLTYTLVCNKPEFSVAVQPGNCWSREFTIDEVQVTGNADVEKIKANLVYQYYNGTDWVECSTRDNVTGRTQQFSSAAEEIAEKTYKVRALYRGAIASAEVDATLEIPEQLPNSGFEDWYEEDQDSHKNLWFPYAQGASGAQWTTNNSETTNYRSESYCSTSAVKRSTVKNSGNYAAWIRTVGHGIANTNPSGIFDWMEAITGTHTKGTLSYADEFLSRPTKVSFYYHYIQKGDDAGVVELKLENKEQEVVLYETSFTVTNTEYVKYDIPVKYSVTGVPATHITLIFESGSKHNEVVSGNERGTDEHYGSEFYVDDISLTYDK
ncbi:DUF4493 domain-containing protein [Bacteroides gallinaceum]|uniref:DUF4493 domain-containing protein n=1 Tax=Bacteroides gallinaceum TaxID=1462571 RepID=UPI0025AA4152|nr:DUF4493 domain-containing protein [Bacteroides gallinaceum]MDN0079165.1 DUF4493 domain-containing protein [Bacteroides gallinaceum]